MTKCVTLVSLLRKKVWCLFPINSTYDCEEGGGTLRSLSEISLDVLLEGGQEYICLQLG